MNWLPFLDLRNYRREWLLQDIGAALAVSLMVVPQGIAYALIAGLPPHMGLYAAGLPVIIGSLFRSSNRVITGPTNAISMIIGGSVVVSVGTSDPVVVASTLALLVGVFQLTASSLRLGTVVDFISSPVLLGFTTGAGILIGAGQLHNVTQTEVHGHNLADTLSSWAATIPDAHGLSVVVALSTTAFILLLRPLDRRIPGASIAMIAATGLSYLAGDLGLRVVSDLAPVPTGLPALTLPDLTMVPELLPLAGACTVLSLVESSAIARVLSSRSGQHLSLTTEFAGEGLANLTSAFFGGYPTAGSLSRSALNDRAGATSRMAGVICGGLVILVMAFFGFLVDYTPVASLAGLLLVVCIDLIEISRIRLVARSHNADRLALGVTLLGTWVLHLDQAIYLGVVISVVLFLQRERMLAVRIIGVDDAGRIREAAPNPKAKLRIRQCDTIHMINLEGPLFFGAASELEAALESQIQSSGAKILVIRLKRTQHMDITVTSALERVSKKLEITGGRMVLVGMRPAAMRYLERIGFAERVGSSHLFPTEERFFAALEHAIVHALTEAGDQHCKTEACPLEQWLQARDVS